MINKIKLEHKNYNNSFFKKYAAFYDVSEVVLSSIRRAMIQEFVKPIKILDVACGTGTLSIALAEKGHTVVGVDLSEDMLNRARKKVKHNLKVDFICTDASKLPFPDVSFDASIISLSLHDMPEVIRLLILNEMRRVTKKGGKIIIAEYNTDMKNNFISNIGQKIPRLWESKYYMNFLRKGLNSYLKEVKLQPNKKQLFLKGVFQISTCIN